jgi:hypothetical protein
MADLCNLWEWSDDGLGDEHFAYFEPERGNVFEMRCLVMYRRKWRRKDGTLYPIPVRAA